MRHVKLVPKLPKEKCESCGMPINTELTHHDLDRDLFVCEGCYEALGPIEIEGI